MRLLAATALGTAVAVLLGSVTAWADDPTIVVQGSAAPSFASKTHEGARPRDTPDTASLFEGLPGLRVRRLGGESSFATLSIRGTASNQIAVSFAGVPITGAADPSLDLSTLPLWPGASARAHRTFAPASLGGGYLGGVVEIRPLELSDRPRTEVYDGLGSFGSYRVRVADTRPLGNGWRLGVGLAGHRTEGDYTYLDPDRGTDVRRENARTAQVGGVIQARRDVGSWTIVLTGLATSRRDGVAGSFQFPLRATRLARDRVLSAIELRKTDDDGRWLVRMWARREGRTFEDPLGEQGISGTAFDTVLGLGTTLGRSFRIGDRLVLDTRFEEAADSSTGVRILAAAPRRDRLRLGMALDATYRASDVTSLALAARADLRNDRGAGVNGSFREVLPAAHLGFEHHLTTWLALAGHGGVLSRAPSFVELLGDGGVFQEAPELRSERALAADLGLRTKGGKSLRWELEVVGFASEVRDFIVLRAVGLRNQRAENVGAARVLGLEASVAAITGPVRVIASYTRLVTEDRTNDEPSRGAPLPGRPGHDLTLDLSVTVGPATLRYGFDLVSSTTLDRAGTLELPTRIFHGVGAKVTVARGLSVLGEVHNLFDQRTASVVSETGAPFKAYPTSDFLGYPIPGRRFSLSIRYAP